MWQVGQVYTYAEPNDCWVLANGRYLGVGDGCQHATAASLYFCAGQAYGWTAYDAAYEAGAIHVSFAAADIGPNDPSTITPAQWVALDNLVRAYYARRNDPDSIDDGDYNRVMASRLARSVNELRAIASMSRVRVTRTTTTTYTFQNRPSAAGYRRSGD